MDVQCVVKDLYDSQNLKYFNSTSPNSCLVLLPSETAAFGQPSPASGWLTQDSGASGTHNNSLGVTEHCGDSVTAGALDIHEVTVGMLDKANIA